MLQVFSNMKGNKYILSKINKLQEKRQIYFTYIYIHIYSSICSVYKLYISNL